MTKKAIAILPPHETADIPLTKLIEWEGNVRKETTDIKELTAMIRAQGLLQPLIVQEWLKGQYRVIDGGRRRRALLEIHDGTAKSAKIHCLVLPQDTSEATLTEISLAGNEHAPLHPVDEYIAFSEMHKQGRSAEDIALSFGCSARKVQQRLALANVHPDLLHAYREGSISLEILQAFAITTDTDRQISVWDGLQPWERNTVHVIRQRLSQDAIDADDPRVKFVTLKSYKAKGGMVDEDLFGDNISLTSPDILNRLVEEKLQKLADKIRNEEGWQRVETYPDRTQAHTAMRTMRRISAEPGELPAKLQRELEKAEKRYKALDDKPAETLTPEEGDELDKLEDRMQEIENERPDVFPQGTLNIAGVILTLDVNGKPDYHRGLVRKEDEKAIARTKRDADKTADASASGETTAEVTDSSPEYPGALIEELSEHRTAAIAADVIGDTTLALRTLACTFAVQMFADEMAMNSFFYANMLCPQISVRIVNLPAMEATPAGELIKRARSDWLAKIPHGSFHDVWQWFMTADFNLVQAFLAFTVGMSIDTMIRQGSRPTQVNLEAIESLHRAAGTDLHKQWAPTVENFWKRVRKDHMIQAIRESGKAARTDLAAMKKNDLAAYTDDLLKDTGWLPAMLRTPGAADVPHENESGRDHAAESAGV